jgi:PAS domain S-box-containing protein
MSVPSPEVERAGGSDPEPSASVLRENRRLRRTVRDLVALSILPAVWSGSSRDEIARSLSDALRNALSLDWVYLRLAHHPGRARVEVVSGAHHGDPVREARVKFAIDRLLDEQRTGEPGVIEDPLGIGSLHATIVRFGVGVDHGVLLACSRKAGFPTEQDRLLLSVGANQMAIVIQRRQAEDDVQAQQEWLRVTLASIGDAVIATDIEGRVTFLNRVACDLVGWTQEEARGQPLASVFRIIDEQSRQPVESPVDRVRREGGVVGLANHTLLIAKDGSEQPIDDSAAPIRDSAGVMLGVVMVFRSATLQRRSEQRRNARLAVTQVLNQSATVDEAAAGVLQTVCENLGWDAGFLWLANDEGRLECRANWQMPHLRSSELEAASYARTFESGEGLPGRVWAAGQPAWISDLSGDRNFPRFAAAAADGLRCGFACPVIVGDRRLAVVEFFTRRLCETDADLLEVMASVAGNIGQFLERKGAENELRRSEEELSEFFENATVGLHWVGPDGTILKVNRSELQLLGYSREEYLGHHIAEFHRDQAAIRDILAKLSAGEKLSEYPARMRCKDGSVKDVLIDSSVRWDEGRFVHTRCFTRDITERRRAEIALADARSRLDSALEAGAIATWSWDIPDDRLIADGKLTELFNLSRPEADVRQLSDVLRAIHPEDRSRIAAALERSVSDGEPYEADYRTTQADGSVRWVTARGRVERDARGRPTRILGVLVDITERKQLEEALREADRRKDEFLATLAHELRNPLAPLRNSLEILKLSRVDAATVQQTRGMMERQVHHLVRLVDDLLDVSRVMRGKITLRKEPLELANVLARALETVQPLIEVQGHRLELSLSNESLPVDGDPVRLAQVIGNLLTNSAKYSEANGHIRVSARRAGTDVVLRVQDDGIGIAPDMLPHIFELFVQADHSSTKAQGGLGIGLTLARNLVQMHGGRIEAHSAGLGQGAEFTVRLPLMRRQGEAATEAADRRGTAEPVSSGHRLLVVDDNLDAATSLAVLLRLQGHEVAVAHDGASALAMAAASRPNLVFLDIGMPGMDGYEVARRLREQPGLESTKLVALTGWGQKEDRRRTAEAGFDHHLVKPLELKSLERLLGAI